MKVLWSMGYPSVGLSLFELYRKGGGDARCGRRRRVDWNAVPLGYEPRSGCRLLFCVMLLIHVALCALTGSFEMSELTHCRWGRGDGGPTG
jgi:hypothetical protein